MRTCKGSTENLSLPLLFWTSGPQSKWILTWRVTWIEAGSTLSICACHLMIPWIQLQLWRHECTARLCISHSCFELRSFSSRFNQISLSEPSCTHTNNRRYRVGELPVLPVFHFLSHFVSFVRMFRFHFLSPSTVSLSQHSHCNALPPLEVVPCVEAPLIPVCLQSPARLNFSLHQLEGCQRSNCQG